MSDPSMTPTPAPKSNNNNTSHPMWMKRKALFKELSLNEIPRNVAWERRRRLKLLQEKKEDGVANVEALSEDLNELKGCIELGFGFNDDQGGQSLANTLPALDIYFAVNRLGSPLVSPNASASSSPVSKLDGVGSLTSKSGRSMVTGEDPWKICSPGDDPKQVKAKLRHWAQAVACSVIHSS